MVRVWIISILPFFLPLLPRHTSLPFPSSHLLLQRNNLLLMLERLPIIPEEQNDQILLLLSKPLPLSPTLLLLPPFLLLGNPDALLEINSPLLFYRLMLCKRSRGILSAFQNLSSLRPLPLPSTTFANSSTFPSLQHQNKIIMVRKRNLLRVLRLGTFPFPRMALILSTDRLLLTLSTSNTLCQITRTLFYSSPSNHKDNRKVEKSETNQKIQKNPKNQSSHRHFNGLHHKPNTKNVNSDASF